MKRLEPVVSAIRMGSDGAGVGQRGQVGSLDEEFFAGV
jgi:hypothetical protein